MYGSVLDEQGQPVANAKVVLEPIEKGARVEVATKGKKGTFLIGIIRAGTYNFKIDAPGMVLISVKAKAMDSLKDKKVAPVWTKDEKIRARFAEVGGMPVIVSSAEANAFVRAQTEKWAKLIKEAGIKAE